MKKLKEKIPQTVTVGPAALWMVVFVVLPISFIFIISFVQMQNKQLVYEFTLKNYKEIFSKLYISYYSESFIIAFANTVICILVGYPAAYLSRISIQWDKPEQKGACPMIQPVRISPRRARDPDEAERRALMSSLSRTRAQINQAYGCFNQTSDGDLIESYVFEINALQARYNYLLRRLKQLGAQP